MLWYQFFRFSLLPDRRPSNERAPRDNTRARSGTIDGTLDIIDVPNIIYYVIDCDLHTLLILKILIMIDKCYFTFCSPLLVPPTVTAIPTITNTLSSLMCAQCS